MTGMTEIKKEDYFESGEKDKLIDSFHKIQGAEDSIICYSIAKTPKLNTMTFHV